MLLREVFDFGVALRALNRNTSILHSNLLAIILNVGLLTAAVPFLGLFGAALAFVVSRFLEGLYLGRCTLRHYGVGIRALACWSDLGKVAVAGLLASVVFYGAFWTDYFGIFGIPLGGIAYLTLFVAVLFVWRVPEVVQLLHRLDGKWLAV